MARIRKGPNRYWSKEDKLKIINEVLINCKSTEEVAKEYDISGGMLRNWIIKYNQYGESSLENKKKPDNPIIESKNGWLKKEMYIDFNQDDYDTVEDYINAIIYDHNYLRPSYALNYKTPIEYRTQLGFK